MKKSLNIKEIAKRAGVSTATVSRVINNKGPVNQKTKDKVMKVIDETGYKPNMIGRQLIEGRTGLIGLIALTISGDAVPKIIEKATTLLSQEGYSIISASSYGDIEKELSFLDMFQKKQVEGIIFFTNELTPKHIESMNKLKVPVVTLFMDNQLTNAASVILDDLNFSFEATNYLIGLGHEHLAYISGPMFNINGQLRYKGFIKAMTENDLLIEESMITEGDWTINSGYEQMKTLLLNKDLTGIVVANEGMAIGAINCIYDHGYVVPDDYSVIGSDDTGLSAAARPSLTTIHLPYDDMGGKAAEILIEAMKTGKFTINKVVMNYDLIVRKSTARLDRS